MHSSDPTHIAQTRLAPSARSARGSRDAKGEQGKTWPECLAHAPTIAVARVRREWLDGSLAFAGAVLGWLTPLMLKQVENAPGGNFYEHGEEILCPLFSCFGAGLGLMSGALWGRRGGEE